MRGINRIIVHHSASARSTTPAQIEQWHRGRGFNGIGYHFVIDAAGTIHRTRPMHQIGAHAKGANGDSLGICLAGNNTDPAEAWTPVQVESLRKLCVSLITAFGPLEIEGHRWAQGGTTATECPGLSRDAWLSLEATMHG